MKLEAALATLARFLAPWSADDFLDRGLTGGFRHLPHDGEAPRLGLLGPDPAATLGAAAHLAPGLTFHSANATGPAPSLQGVTDVADFQARIAEFHARNYSVRFPDLRPLSPALDALCRALEVLLLTPVTASAFWSVSGMRAPVHYDDHDLLIVQLAGTKRWYVGSRPSALFNAWKGVSGNPPDLGPHDIVDVAPGDLMYLPRGTFHTVDSDAFSVHLALGFTPLTLREALVAALDHLSDLDRPLRETVGARIAWQLEGAGVDPLGPPIARAAQQLAEAVCGPAFLASALHRRASRTIAALAPLPRPPNPPALSLDTWLRHADLAASHLIGNPEILDFAYPGGHLYIHRGAEAAVLFVAETPRFRVRDIPGGLPDDVRLALATRFVQVGFLAAG
ncbi:MAG: hypothetical protein JF588_18840 [Caulobacterales bacterium]|nr:hypothetical protein [Caulobacterales bacterium]